MDDTLCHYQQYIKLLREQHDGTSFPQEKRDFWVQLLPITKAVESVNILRKNGNYDVYILTAPSVRNPRSYMEKRLWVEHHFDYDFCKKLIITPNKGLLRGDYLIDDYINGRGQESFGGELIHFGSDRFPS